MSALSYLKLINERYTGDPDKHWFSYSIEKYICTGDTSQKSVLILGSNEGWMEIALRQAGFAGRIVASDIADKALERASKRVRELGLQGVEHQRADLNVDRFPAVTFDFVVVEGVLHHIENIAFCIEGLNRPGFAGNCIQLEP
ncbi:class I SAM-dependent methyltransferase [Phreatobacter oligotrophus]|uniref:class I SAM-dependent methyltransferase n=1 Tax=Phreatobacter oligotrophus TaxID=1122261 RepID=UPI000D39B286|nr:class I SAM-dependent methyltransferase [Phreatobacter oligotrophus]